MGTMDEKPEALHLADMLEAGNCGLPSRAAAELRRLHEKVNAKREWVGLTDEEIDQGQKESWVTKQAWESAVWWAEAKLKEKNT